MAKLKMTFENASKQLEEILDEMSDENTGLDKTIELYSKAAELISFCNSEIKKAQLKVDEINVKYYSEE